MVIAHGNEKKCLGKQQNSNKERKNRKEMQIKIFQV